jgi:asparagine synthase (glutamine-hydrolysing)
MSGIVGLWHLDGRRIDPGVFARMTAALRHRACDGEDVRNARSFALAHQHLWIADEEIGERQPLVNARGVLTALDGRIDNRDDLLPVLGLPTSATDASCALAAYERWGASFAEHVNGEFAIAIADPSRSTVLLARDAIGIRPLYYAHTRSLFAFASEIKALLAHPDVPVRPDDDGLADYLMIGARPLDRQDVTCFAGISAVVPSHVIVVSPERLTTRRYWDFDTSATLRLASAGEYADAFRDRFSTAVRRRARGRRPVAVSVSGGLDSSSIFCMAEVLRRNGRIDCPPPVGISFTSDGGGDADERGYLVEIEDAYGVTIERFPMDMLTGIVDGAAEQVRAVEAPFLDCMWAVTRELQRRVASNGARVLFSGQWGDQVLFSSAYLVDFCTQFAFGRVRQHAREYARYFGAREAAVLLRRVPGDAVRYYIPRTIVGPIKWLKRRLLRENRAKSWFSDRFRQYALRYADRPATIGSAFHSAHAQSIYLEARSKYHVQCMEWHNKIGALRGLQIALPLLDRDLLAFLMAIPGDAQTRDGVPRALLRDAMSGILPDAIRTRRWKADFGDVVNRSVANDARAICEALADSQAVRLGYLDASRVEPELSRLVAGLTAPDNAASWDLADVYGLEVWLRVFLGQ